MIRINFLADEIAQERKARIRKRTVAVYAAAWFVAILIAFAQFQHNRSLINTYNRQVGKLKVEIDAASPQFKRAVRLYLKRNKSKKALGGFYQSTVEPGFILDTLQNLVKKTPPDFWLNEVTLSTTDKTVSADNEKKGSAGKQMNIEGNLFLAHAKSSNALQKYLSEIQASEPFSLAQCRLNLNEMKLKRFGDKYSHNFEMTFSWP